VCPAERETSAYLHQCTAKPLTSQY